MLAISSMPFKSILGLLMGMMTTFFSWGQTQDCWLFINAHHSLSSLSNLEGVEIVGQSEWMHAVAVVNLPDHFQTQHPEFAIDSMICYSQDVMAQIIVCADTTDSSWIAPPPQMDDSTWTYTDTLGYLYDSTAVTTDEWTANTESHYAQITLLQGQLFIDRGIDGSGVTIGVLDAGFVGMREDSTLQYLFNEGRITATHDFVRGDSNVFRSSEHGTEVMSCLAGKDDFNQFGLATGATFVLARAEQNFSAYLIQEARWIEALEWVVGQGAQIVTSSLIYSDQLYKRTQMNGSSFLSKAAERAWQKGVLILNSAGNSGQGYWEIIGAPGDAEHVLTVGACNYNGLKCDFSSTGPTSDYRLKPNVVAKGDVFVSAGNEVKMVSGTSFACPLVAGFAACVLQRHPEKRASDLWDELQQSASLYPYYDYAHGYGVPQASYFLDATDSLSIEEDTLQIEIQFTKVSDNLIEINIEDSEYPIVEVTEDIQISIADAVKDSVAEWLDNHADSIVGMQRTIPDSLNIEWGDSTAIQEEPEAANENLLFVHIEDPQGHVQEYWVTELYNGNGGMYDVFAYKGCKLRAYYRRRISTFLIE